MRITYRNFIAQYRYCTTCDDYLIVKKGNVALGDKIL